MLELGRWSGFKGLAAIAAAILAISVALIHFFPAPPTKFSIATGFKGGSAEFVGNSYKERLARRGVEVDVLLTDGSGEDFKLLQDPTSGVKVAVIQGGVSNSKEKPGLLSLGRINYQVFWIFYRGTDTLDDLTQLRGKRISVGPTGSGTETVATKLLRANGIDPESSKLLPLAGAAAAEALKGGSSDVMFLANTADAPLYKSLLQDPGIRVMSLRRAEAFTRIYPFLVRLVLPEGVIDPVRNIPSADVTLLATTNAIIVREDIHPAIVGLLVEAMLEEHGEAGIFQRVGTFPTQSDPEFPMDQNALDYYKNGPSFLSRYLPFWIVVHVHRAIAVLVTLVAVVVPLVRNGPTVLRWLVETRLNSMYRRLRGIEATLQRDVTISELEALEAELEAVDRAVSVLAVPIRNSDLYFDVKSHIDLERTRIEARRAKLQGHFAKAA
jgi:TRAP-type uncharacterized transport system substrate-binding protein